MATQMPRYVTHKVVEAQDLEWHTTSGWKLEEVLRETRAEKHMESVPFMQSGGYVSRESQDKVMAVAVTRFLVSRRPDDPLMQKTQEAQHLNDALRNARLEVESAQNNIKAKDKELALAQKSLETANASVESYRTQYYAEQKLKQKMETDIAKVRQAVGELKMKEILAS
jgi:hypothetical protein